MKQAIHIMSKETKETLGFMGINGTATMDEKEIMWIEKKDAGAWARGANKLVPTLMHTAMDKDLVEWGLKN